MEMQQLHAFSLLAQYENMSTVAQILNTSQPQISKLIASLEAELGVRLFDRVGRGLRISEHGQLFCQYAEEALASMQSAKMAMKNLRNSILGTVRIGTFAFAPILNPCLLAYTKKEPNVNFCYIQRSLSSLKRDIDILLTSSENGYYTAENHFPVYCNLFEEEYYMILSPKFRDYPEGKTSIDLHETKDFPFIVMGQSHPYKTHTYDMLQAFSNVIGFTPRVAYEVNEFVFKVLLVSEGAGIAFLPKVCLPAAKTIAPDLRILSIERYSTTRSVLLARQRRGEMSPAANDFWDFAIEYFHQPADVLP